MRYLTSEQASSNLRVGKTLEQLLDAVQHSRGRVLRWVKVGPGEAGDFEVTLFEAFEDERAAYDIYGLYAVELDQDGAVEQAFAAGKSRHFTDPDDAMAHACESLGASPERFLNRGFLEDDYRERFGSPVEIS